MKFNQKFKILYVDDSPADIEFLKVAFSISAPDVEVDTVDSGAAAIAKLARNHQENELPEMILLDLKMPGMDGHEVLSNLKQNPDLRRIPVVILTSSRLQEDILRAYDVGANCYLPKPDDATGYEGIAIEVHRFWMDTAIIPRPRGG